MKNLDLNNPDHKKAIQEVLKQGADGQFWEIICQDLQETIDATQQVLDSGQFSDLEASEYKIKIEVLRQQKEDRLFILKLPENLVNDLDDPDFFARNREEDFEEELSNDS